MRWRILIFLIILGLVLPITAEADVYSVDANISMWGHFDVWLTLERGERISIDIQETTGGGIDIYIFDEENYDLFSPSAELPDYLERYQNRAVLQTTITVPESGTWYVVFWNTDGSSRHVEGTVKSVSSGFEVLLAVAIIIIVAGACLCYAYKKNLYVLDKKKQPQPHPYPQQPAQPPQYRPTPQQEESVRFCPYCGTQRQSYDAQLCSRCGKAFND